jgi:large subunit ribosomal protein L15
MKAGFRGMSSRNARMAKRRGFTNIFKQTYQIVNVGRLAALGSGTAVDAAALERAGLVADASKPIKILGDGDLAVPLTVSGVRLTASARQKIEAAGGSVTEDAVGTTQAQE